MCAIVSLVDMPTLITRSNKHGPSKGEAVKWPWFITWLPLVDVNANPCGVVWISTNCNFHFEKHQVYIYCREENSIAD